MKNLSKDLQAFANKYEDTNFYASIEEMAQYCEYASGLCGMTFEGIVYEAVNHYGSPSILNELDAICEKHNVWYELGNAWNCCFYKN